MCHLETGNVSNEHEIIVEPERRNDKDYSRRAANHTRRDLIKALHTSIEEKTEMDAKKRELEPRNSRAGTDLRDVNREVDQALKDPLQARINPREMRSNTKRALSADGPSQGCKATKGRPKRSSTSAVRASPEALIQRPNQSMTW